MSERDAWRGQLAIAQEELSHVETLWVGKIRALRSESNPIATIEEPRTDIIAEYSKDLGLLKKRHGELTFHIKRLEQLLNG